MSKSLDTDPKLPEPLPLPVIDNHAHIGLARAGAPAPDIAQILRTSAQLGVDRVIEVGCTVADCQAAVAAAQQYPQLLAAVALHPNEAPLLAEAGQLDAALTQIEELAAQPRVRVIGETGLDYFRTGPQGVQAQKYSFARHIDLAKRSGLPMQIHDRDAHEDVLAVLAEQGAPEVTVFHCFSGDAAMARTCLERGYYLSFSGTVTFKNARGLREALAVVPLDRVLIETDSPYLAPSPVRGALNGPYLMPYTVRFMADVLDVTTTELIETVNNTAERLYGPW